MLLVFFVFLFQLNLCLLFAIPLLICFLFLSMSLQLAPRQEPVLDSSKYTAADVRIVSTIIFVSAFSVNILHNG